MFWGHLQPRKSCHVFGCELSNDPEREAVLPSGYGAQKGKQQISRTGNTADTNNEASSSTLAGAWLRKTFPTKLGRA